MSIGGKRILVTGSQGFIGRNLVTRLGEIEPVEIVHFDRGDDPAVLPDLVVEADAIVHLAGENRPKDERAYAEVNEGLTVSLCNAVRQVRSGNVRSVPLVLASSAQVELDNPYGRSKLAAEKAVQSLADETGNPCIVFRLPGVFGKWGRPNYNSVVATFCHNIARGTPIRISDPSKVLRLVYIDDLADAVLAALDTPTTGFNFAYVSPEYTVTLGELAAQIEAFEAGREQLRVEHVGAGLGRALYATYISHLPPTRFVYDIPRHHDERGVFIEMLKTPDSGQFSYFTAGPGITRGGHYHHTKSEKFLVIKGKALFRFRHLVTNERLEIITSGDAPQVVETIPGWSHDVTNIGTEELAVMLWANEVFDRDQPDTIAAKV
mgnify:CR=1 FL=1